MAVDHWVAPFGNLCLTGYLLLNTAFRSLSRPSSPPRAWASTMRPFCFLLFLIILSFARSLPVLRSFFPLEDDGHHYVTLLTEIGGYAGGTRFIVLFVCFE